MLYYLILPLIPSPTWCLAKGKGALNKIVLIVSLKGQTQELFAIGDCQKPRNLLDASDEGARVAGAI